MHGQTAFFVEPHGRGIAGPDVEGEVVVALRTGVCYGVIVEDFAVSLASHGGIHAQIVNVQSRDLLHGSGSLYLTDAEAISNQNSIRYGNEHGGIDGMGKNLSELVGGVLLATGDENVGTSLGMETVDLVEQVF